MLLLLHAFLLVVVFASHVQCATTTPSLKALRGYTAESTALEQFIPFMNTDIPSLVAGNGFANNHVTKIAASVGRKGGIVGSLRVHTVNTGEYSHQVSIYDYPVFTTTSMSCSGATEESVRTCVWTVESRSSRNITQIQTSTYTESDSKLSTYTWTASDFVWDEFEASTFTGTVLVRDHIWTINMDMLVHPTITGAVASTTGSSASSTTM